MESFLYCLGSTAENIFEVAWQFSSRFLTDLLFLHCGRALYDIVIIYAKISNFMQIRHRFGNLGYCVLVEKVLIGVISLAHLTASMAC